MFKKTFLLLLFFVSVVCQYAQVASYHVVPLPQTISLVKGKPFVLNAQTQIVCDTTHTAMQNNAHLLAEYIEDLTGLKLAVVRAKSKATNAIVLSLDNKVNGKEAYTLVVNSKQVRISGSTAAGVFYGIQTLRKSLPLSSYINRATPTPTTICLPAVNISDAPLLSYRGVMLDCARRYYPLPFLKRFIDILALHHINTFHWHITDDQGWRIEIKKHPRLTAIGSKRKGTVVAHNSDVNDSIPYSGYYTQDEARELVQYAAKQHISVVPEVDLPGHTRALLTAYPDMGCTGGPYEVGVNWGVHHDVLCVGNNAIYPLLHDIIDELCDIFPSPYFHIGGDEVPTTRWKQCKKCRALAEKEGVEAKKLQGVFTNHIEQYLKSKGKTLVGWDEILHGDINPSAVVMSWTGVNPGFEAAKQGHDVIMSPEQYAYIDHYQSKDRSTEPYAIGGFLSVEKAYSFNPLPDSLSVDARKHIIGVQANLWTAYISYETQVEYMLLPRLAAISEVQWVPAKRKNYDDFYQRLTCLRALYNHYGYNYAMHIWHDLFEKHRAIK